MTPRRAKNRAEVIAANAELLVATTCPSCKARPKARGEDYCAVCIAATAPRARCPQCGGTVELTEAERHGRTFPVAACTECEFIVVEV